MPLHTVEMQAALNSGANANSIIYAQPAKQLSHLRYALEMDVRKVVIDGDFELYKIQKHFPNAE